MVVTGMQDAEDAIVMTVMQGPSLQHHLWKHELLGSDTAEGNNARESIHERGWKGRQAQHAEAE